MHVVRQRDDCPEDLTHVLLAGIEGHHEGLVDLQLVEGEAPEIAERGIAGAEIVHVDGHAERLQLVQLAQNVVGALEQQRFDHLDLHPASFDAGRLQRLADDRDEIAVTKLHRGEVDRDEQMLGP